MRPYRAMGSACHTLKDQGPSVLLQMGIRSLALGADDVHAHVLVHPVGNPALGKPALEDDSSPFHVSCGSQLLEQVGKKVVTFSFKGIAYFLEVPEDSKLSLVDHFRVRYLEPLVVGNIVWKIVTGTFQQCLIIHFCAHRANVVVLN